MCVRPHGLWRPLGCCADEIGKGDRNPKSTGAFSAPFKVHMRKGFASPVDRMGRIPIRRECNCC